MYPPHHLGGYELVWRSAVEHLRAGGHEVSVLTTGHRRDGVTAPDPPHVHRTLRWWWRDHAWPAFSLRERLAVERHNAAVLAERLAADAPDVVAWWSMGGMSLSLVERVRRAGLPAVGFVHDEWLLYGPGVDAWLRTWPRPLAALAERATGVPTRVDLRGAARWLFVSEHVRGRALSVLELARTGVAPSGVDAALLGDPAPERPWAGRLLCVGRLDERKGLDTAIEALAALPGATLTIVGDGAPDVVAGLRALAARLGVAERVELAGFAEGGELRRRYAEADAVLFPVRWDEPWGLVPLEAMAAGRPVLATGRGGSAEYLRDGENALLFAAGDAAALAAAVTRLAGDDTLRARLRAGGLETAPRHTAEAFNRRVEAALAAAEPPVVSAR
jgi:glycosyltransferase involved in cell wall biosynthesis